MYRTCGLVIVAVLLGCVLAGPAQAVEVRVPVDVQPPKPPEPKPEMTELKAGFLAVDLTGHLNSDGITDEADRNDADFDEWKQSFAAEELPSAGTLEPKGLGVAFLFPAKDPKKYNNVACNGQKIPVKQTAKALHFLVTATDANQERKVGIEYADDSKVQADLQVTDWCGTPAFGEKAAVTCPSRVAVDAAGQGKRAKEKRETHIWAVTVPLDPKRELSAIVLPRCPKIHVFAITVAN
jgi:hypothetical protein